MGHEKIKSVILQVNIKKVNHMNLTAFQLKLIKVGHFSDGRFQKRVLRGGFWIQKKIIEFYTYSNQKIATENLKSVLQVVLEIIFGN